MKFDALTTKYFKYHLKTREYNVTLYIQENLREQFFEEIKRAEEHSISVYPFKIITLANFAVDNETNTFIKCRFGLTQLLDEFLNISLI